MMEGMGQRFLTATEKVWRVLVDLSPGNHYQYTILEIIICLMTHLNIILLFQLFHLQTRGFVAAMFVNGSKRNE
jgi:hypothetical protein